MSDADSRLTAAEVLRRYKEENLPAFCEIDLQDVNQAGNFGERPLDVAACRGNTEEMIALLEAGADVNAPGELGNTPLNEAVGQNYIQAVKLLLSYGASPNIQNEFGSTALDIARLNGHQELVTLLEAASGRR